jgi:hypothetical protein
LLVVFLLPAPVPARAEEPPDGPKRIFQDEFIENLTGDWKLTRKIRDTQAGNTVRVEWVLNHQFLQVHMKDTASPLVLIGYSHADRHYVIHWCDNFGGKYSSMGFGKRSGNSIEFEFKDADGSFFYTLTWDPKTKGWTFLMESEGKNGQRVFFAEDKLRRP